MLKYIFLVLSFITIGYAQNKAYSEVSVEFKNDVFFGGDDKDYTSGFEVSYTPSNKAYKIYLGQDIYTSTYYNETYPSANQHPYAGWLYLGLEKNIEIANDITSIIRLDIGTVGDDSLAQDTVDMVHSLIDAHKYYGWDTQMEKNVAYILSGKVIYNYDLTSQININPYVSIQTGNIIQNYGLGVDLSIELDNYFDIYTSIDIKHISKNYFLEGEAKNSLLTYRAIKEDTVKHFTFGIETKYVNDYKLILGIELFSKTYLYQQNNSKIGVIKLVKRF